MRSLLRSTVVGSALVAGLLPAPPAHAAGGVHFIGTAYVECHGCGVSHGTADLTVSGVVNGTVVVGSAHADFTAYSGQGVVGCVISGQAIGTVTGAVNVDFAWARVGNVALITVRGEVNGAGHGTIVGTQAGIPCGGPAQFTVEGSIAGA
jgi:hypothetical protein